MRPPKENAKQYWNVVKDIHPTAVQHIARDRFLHNHTLPFKKKFQLRRRLGLAF